MATATHAPYRALLARVRKGPDEAAAAAVTAFVGDINACPFNDNTVLHVAIAHKRPLTVAALAARGDCNPNVVARLGTPVLCQAASWYSDRTDMATFMAQFPTVDIDACDSAGLTPLHYAAVWGREHNAQWLLDAGADPTMRTFEVQVTPAQLALQIFDRTHCTELLEAAEAWHAGLRRGWLRAVVGVSKI